MLLLAMNEYQVAKQDHREMVKGQYQDKTGTDGAKTYFRASELGSGDRKIVYSFFKHHLPTIPKTAKNLRQLENGDKCHERYQTAWEDMGVLISMEERLSSKDDEYLAKFDWEWAGHYDGLLDVNILRAHALGKCTLNSVKNDQDQWELEVEIDDEFAKEVGIFEENYEPLTMVADIKTMNPFGFKSLKGGNLTKITGYIDQLSFYMYMLNTPYGSIFVEDKGSNDLCEIQVVWTDMHEDVVYGFTEEVHGKDVDGIHRITINNDRFFGSTEDTGELGLVPRVEKLWATKKALELMDSEGTATVTAIASIMPPRCSEDPANFPCSWGKGAEKCEFFEHCWDTETGGNAIKPVEVGCPEDLVWEFFPGTEACEKVDSRKIPAGITYESLEALLKMSVIDITPFLVTEAKSRTTIPATEAEETALNIDHLFGAGGALKLGAPVIVETVEYITEGGSKAIQCTNCQKEVTYTRLGTGSTKPCPFCSHKNKVIKN